MDQDNHPNNRNKEQAPKGTAMINQQLTAAKPIAKDWKEGGAKSSKPKVDNNPAAHRLKRLNEVCDC